MWAINVTDSSSVLSFRIVRRGEGGAESDLGINIGEFVADRDDFGSSCPLLDPGLTGERVEHGSSGEGGSGDARSITTPFSKLGNSVFTMLRSRADLLTVLLLSRSLSRSDSSSKSTKLLGACTCSRDTPETTRERAEGFMRA